MARLNDTAISKLRWDSKKRTQSGRTPQFQGHSDGEVKGLYLRVYPPNSDGQSTKVWYLTYSSQRKSYKIGEWPTPNAEAARIEALTARHEFYSQGIDPNEKRRERLKKERERREREKERLTVSELFGAYMAEREPGWAESYRSANRRHVRRIEDAFGTRFADQITATDDIEEFFLKRKNHSKSMAELMRKFGQQVFQWGMRKKQIPLTENPFDLIGDSSSSELNPFKINREKRTRCLDFAKGEAGQLFAVCAEYDRNKRVQRPGSISYEAVAKLYLLTGWRAAELRNARWEHLDCDLRTLRNVAPKGPKGQKKPYTSPLTDMAVELLETLGTGDIKDRTGPIFPSSRGGTSPGAMPLKRWERWYTVIAKMPGMPVDKQYAQETGQAGHIMIHDLRRSAITWLQSMRFDEETRTTFKGSKVFSVTSSVYSQADAVDIRRECAEAIEARILDVEGGNERAMFDQWRAGKKARPADRLQLVAGPAQ